ncbi:pilus assembly protein [Georgenia satyanarayanai]|uniref:TadE/TadG family type IV pilus assembly protein n=1 Tax=Georgenia satyanarayanai TaxID=860221 RepID=UPI002041F0E5|nr:TadE/TadG family type IV pilus assembly protein [Georgenia satyanarayanai]MCM3661454.1 pilus assembly protein [Georgenia satyanarayanai]
MVEFVLVSVLVVAVLLGVLQLTLALHVRNTIVDAAGEGARHGALEGSSPAAGAERTRELIGMALHPRYGDDVSAEVVERDGMALVEVTVRAPVPVLGLLGPSGTMTASGRAVQE